MYSHLIRFQLLRNGWIKSKSIRRLTSVAKPRFKQDESSGNTVEYRALELSEKDIPYCEQLAEDSLSILRSIEQEHCVLGLSLTTDESIAKLNQEHLGVSGTTDVLSFPVGEGVRIAAGILGDLVISIDTAKVQAKDMNHSIQDELRILSVHGILHLLGYNHYTELEKLEMLRMEQQILSSLQWKGLLNQTILTRPQKL